MQMGSTSKRNIVSAIAAIIIGLFVYSVSLSVLGPTVTRVIIKAEMPIDMEVHIGTVSNKGVHSKVDSILVTGKAGRSAQRISTKLLDLPFGRLTLSFHVNESEHFEPTIRNQIKPIIIHNVQIIHTYSDDSFINDRRILDFFDGSSAADNQYSLPIANAGNYYQLISKETIDSPTHVYAVGLAFIFAFGCFFLIRQIQISSIPAFKDMSLGRDISSTHEFGTINGLRGLAALLVLFSHTAPGFEALQVGLAMLFVISGFLLSKPFILTPNKIFNIANIEIYLVKRLKRILPMYYIYIFMVYVVTMNLDIALRHFLFVQAEGHLWPMTQIFAFYLLLPFILLITSLLFEANRVLPIILLSLVAVWWWSNLNDWRPFYNGQGYREFLLHAFLMGVIASYIQYGFIVHNQALLGFIKKWSWVFAGFGLTITALTIAWSAPVSPPDFIAPYINQFYVKCILCVLILLLALNTVGTWFNALISSWLLRSVGVVGFSFYILHGLGMKLVLSTQTQLFGITDPSQRSWSFMLLAFLVTYIMSLISYSFVERPFFGYRRKG